MCTAIADPGLEKLESGLSDADQQLVRRAFERARSAHQDQTRDSGEPYIAHPLAVAQILKDLEMDPATLVAGLLHDVVEDTSVSLDDVRRDFGPDVATLVDGVTKLEKSVRERLSGGDRKRGAAEAARLQQAETLRRAENLRKIFLAMASDVRVMVVKLADRLHNMQTLGHCDAEKQTNVASETMQIYAPLAHRLGIWTIKWQLEDLAFKYLEPERFAEVAEQVARTRHDREADIQNVTQALVDRLKAAGIDALIQGRPKHLWSIYQKMLSQEISFSQIYDLTAVRIIVHTVPECYQALGIVHEEWIPIPGMFSDHIAHPKPNMYQSLHTKVMTPQHEPLEIQIRTFEMHKVADLGVAATVPSWRRREAGGSQTVASHWRYKEGGQRIDPFEQKLAQLRQQLFEWHADSGNDSGEFLRSVTNDLFATQVFVFTPRGEVLDLPAGSTPVDFAYRVHSQVGETCVGARVNGHIVSLDAPLKNGDVVDIHTRTGASPSRDWLRFVKSTHAKNKIKAWFRRLLHAENVTHGRELLEREAERLGMEASDALREEALRRAAAAYHFAGEEELLAAVGAGTLGPAAVMAKIREEDLRRGRDLFNAECNRRKWDTWRLTREDVARALCAEFRRSSLDNLFVSVGAGRIPLASVMDKLPDPTTLPPVQLAHDSAPDRAAPLNIQASGGVDQVLIRRSKCCLPLPGDAVAAYVSRGRGMVLHRTSCKNLLNYRQREPDRIVEVDWPHDNSQRFDARLKIEATDRVGLLNDVAAAILETKTNIQSAKIVSQRNHTALFDLTVDVTDSVQLAHLIARIDKLPDILRVDRVPSGAAVGMK